MYEYRAVVIRVVDGDTVDLHIDQGLEIYRLTRVRLASINTAELNSPNPEQRELAQRAQDWLRAKLPAGTQTTIKTFKDRREKYGRYLVMVYLDGDEVSINEQLVSNGLAVPYMVITSPQAPVIG